MVCEFNALPHSHSETAQVQTFKPLYSYALLILVKMSCSALSRGILKFLFECRTQNQRLQDQIPLEVTFTVGKLLDSINMIR